MEKKKYEYIDGSAVRKFSALPEYRPEIEKRKKTSKRPAQKTRIDGKMLAFLGVVMVMSVFFCMSLLNVQASITEVKSQMETTQDEISVLKTKNDSVEYEISSYIDVDYILKIAKTELGMVVADKSQVIMYKSSPSEYMNQFSDVPEN